MPWDNRSRRRAELPRDWSAIQRRVLERDGYRCQLAGPRCVGRATEVDHQHERHDHRLSNLRAACSPCHRARTAEQGNDVMRQHRAAAQHPRERHPGLA